MFFTKAQHIPVPMKNENNSSPPSCSPPFPVDSTLGASKAGKPSFSSSSSSSVSSSFIFSLPPLFFWLLFLFILYLFLRPFYPNVFEEGPDCWIPWPVWPVNKSVFCKAHKPSQFPPLFLSCWSWRKMIAKVCLHHTNAVCTLCICMHAFTLKQKTPGHGIVIKSYSAFTRKTLRLTPTRSPRRLMAAVRTGMLAFTASRSMMPPGTVTSIRFWAKPLLSWVYNVNHFWKLWIADAAYVSTLW